MKTRSGYLFQRGRVWYLQYRVNGRKYVESLGTEEVEEAKQKREEIMAPITKGGVGALKSALKVRLSDLGEARADALRCGTIALAWERFASSPKRRRCGDVTLAGYKSQWERFAQWASRHSLVTIEDVSSVEAERYMRDLQGFGVTLNTYNKHLRLLKMFFRVVGNGHLTVNPFDDMPCQPQRGKTHRVLTTKELQSLVESARGEWNTLVLLGIYTGFRLKDCATLRWSEVDLASAVICRVPAKTARRTGKTVYVPVHPVLAHSLYGIDRAGAFVLPDISARYEKDRSSVAKQVSSLIRRCHIYETESGMVGFHSLRHTFVTVMREANVSEALVQSIVGHGSSSMTARYTHAGLESARNAVALLPEVTAGEQLSSACVAS